MSNEQQYNIKKVIGIIVAIVWLWWGAFAMGVLVSIDNKVTFDELAFSIPGTIAVPPVFLVFGVFNLIANADSFTVLELSGEPE